MTTDPEEADFFYVPPWTYCIEHRDDIPELGAFLPCTCLAIERQLSLCQCAIESRLSGEWPEFDFHIPSLTFLKLDLECMGEAGPRCYTLDVTMNIDPK